ncbi:MAG TPA: hypothetical protein VFM99_10615 [Chitinophagales bacterium]|nr:hypothetical protein [Chitinophagales bacterium]
MNKDILKKTGIILLGIVAIFVLPGICDATLILSGLPPFPQKPESFTSIILVISFAYRVVFVFVGGYIVGKLASNKPMVLVLIFAIICILIALYGIIAGWNLPSYPHWYPIGLFIFTFPAVWYGGKLALKKKTNNQINYLV